MISTWHVFQNKAYLCTKFGKMVSMGKPVLIEIFQIRLVFPVYPFALLQAAFQKKQEAQMETG